MATREYSSHTQSLLRWRNHLLDQHNEREGAKHPAAPMAQAIYGGRPKGSASEYDRSKRQHVSPLGGVAVVASTGKDKR